jgi:putative ABC transport system permease protein
MLLASLWLVRTDLLADWERTLPAHAPNAFAVNIAPAEIDRYINELNQAKIVHSTPFPIIRGRVVEINGFAARKTVQDAQDKDVLRRELSFTFGEQIPSYNSLSEGTWNNEQGVSVESKVAKDLALKIGDTLTFSINSQKVTATVNSIRTVEWRDMRPNFYFIFTPDVLETMPKTFLMSFKIEDGNSQFLNDLSRKYPTVSVFDIRSIGEKVQAILAQIVWAITLLAVVSLVAGLLLIFTLLRLSLSQRRDEIQLYRMLGASKTQILRTVWCEYGVLALIGSFFALIGTEAVVACIMHIGFELQPTLHMWLWFSLPLLTFFVLALVVRSMLSELLIRTDRE